MLQGFSIPPYPYIEIPEGRWTTETSAKKPIPRNFALTHLRGNPNFNVQLPHDRFLANDESHLTIASPIDSVNGWGRAASNIINEMSKIMDNLVLYPLANWFYEDVPENTRTLMRKPYRPTKWGLALTIPSEYNNIPCRNLVSMSMWETSALPKEWEQPLNQFVRHLIVPSKSQVDLFRQQYRGNISVVPLGVDTDVFTYQERPQRGEDEPFTIITWGLLSSRKAPIQLITEVVYRAFAGLDDWKLILKTRRGALGAGKFRPEIEDSRIQVISADWHDHQLVELCHNADVAIFPSRFEGFGLGMREAMSTGLPVIVSANTGHLDDCDGLLNYPIPTHHIMSAEEAYSENENWQWHEPDYEQMAATLRLEYETWKLRGRTQSAMGRRAAEYIRAKRTWKHTAEGIYKVLCETVPAARIVE